MIAITSLHVDKTDTITACFSSSHRSLIVSLGGGAGASVFISQHHEKYLPLCKLFDLTPPAVVDPAQLTVLPAEVTV